MTELDQSLEQYLQDEKHQADYYDLLLNTDFFIPITDPSAAAPTAEDNVTPLIVETDGKPYIMLFDSEERLFSWAKQSVNYVVITGYGVAKISPPNLHWAVNIGGQFAKELVPEEISWLKERVQQKGE